MMRNTRNKALGFALLAGLFAAALCVSVHAGEAHQIVFSTEFDSGGGVSVSSRTEHHFDLTLEDEQGYGPLGYMHFRLEGVKGKTVSFAFTNLGASRMPSNHRLLYSETPLHDLTYRRMEETVGNGFSHTFESDTVYVCNYYPYPYQNTVEQVTRHKEDRFATVMEIGKSHQGRPMHAMQVSDPDVPDEQKRDIVILTRQHPGETTGSYQMDGMIEYVIEVFREDALAFEGHYRFHFLPNANPDGIYLGFHRQCTQGHDFNRRWATESPVEIRNLKTYMIENVTNAWWGFDLHATTNRNYTALFHQPTEAEEMAEAARAIADRIVSLSSVRVSTSQPSRARGFYAELGGFMVITEKSLYSQEMDEEFLREQGRNFLMLAAPAAALVAD